MPGCILRIDGTNFDPDAFLAASGLVADTVYHRGDGRRGGRVSESGGFTVLVSEAGVEEFEEQIEAAVEFLRINNDELTRLARFPGVETVLLDFGCAFPNQRVAGRFFRLPLPLLRECAEVGVEVELSVYAEE